MNSSTFRILATREANSGRIGRSNVTTILNAFQAGCGDRSRPGRIGGRHAPRLRLLEIPIDLRRHFREAARDLPVLKIFVKPCHLMASPPKSGHKGTSLIIHHTQSSGAVLVKSGQYSTWDIGNLVDNISLTRFARSSKLKSRSVSVELSFEA